MFGHIVKHTFHVAKDQKGTETAWPNLMRSQRAAIGAHESDWLLVSGIRIEFESVADQAFKAAGAKPSG